ncbi:DSD1 family PLP-dependent enzyme [Orrella sp. JC864]|uniref:DSD1 family PLP-dependent enzyme n=1 Tax=Orrella sp. JC864 TaxID=3120298 RepID=UPI00300896FF
MSAIPATLPAAHRGPPPAPAQPGDDLAQVDTPALLLDLDVMEANLRGVHARIQAAGLRIRAHGKAHKCPPLALRQIDAGAQGICCQKVGEAEVFASWGVQDILVTNQVVGPAKAERAARLAGQVRLAVCLDDAAQVAVLAQAARRHGTQLGVLVELDVGQGRCGVADPAAVVALAQAIEAQAPALAFRGLQAYRGSAQHLREPQARRQAVEQACAQVRTIVQALAARGLSCELVTGGGTGSYLYELESGLYNEVQPGSYVLMDTDYGANQPDPQAPALGHALSAWCTVISAQGERAVLDGGLKAFAVDAGLPRVLAPGWKVSSLSDEHTVIVKDGGARPLAVGERVRLLPSHCDPTVNLHDWLVAVRGERVEHVWPVAARGALF